MRQGECQLNPNAAYAEYMLAWLKVLELPAVPELDEARDAIVVGWRDGKDAYLEGVKMHLWAWVDANGGPRLSTAKPMLYARMLICLCEPDNRELEEMGFFDDLLNNFGVARAEINKFNTQNLPSASNT